MSQLWEASYSKCEGNYQHPYGKFNHEHPLLYIDRACFRVPDEISELHSTDKDKKKGLQRSLTPHIDCCPHKMFDDGDKQYAKWRPIQAFISLTGKCAIFVHVFFFS